MAIQKKCRYCDRWVRVIGRIKGDCIHHIEQTDQDFSCDEFAPNQPSRSLDYRNKCEVVFTLGWIIAVILLIIYRR